MVVLIGSGIRVRVGAEAGNVFVLCAVYCGGCGACGCMGSCALYGILLFGAMGVVMGWVSAMGLLGRKLVVFDRLYCACDVAGAIRLYCIWVAGPSLCTLLFAV